jgi:2-methylcitrate dehydratase
MGKVLCRTESSSILNVEQKPVRIDAERHQKHAKLEEASAGSKAMASHHRPAPDDALVGIADYVSGYEIKSPAAYSIARFSVMDSIGCAIEAQNFPECTKLLGPIVPGIVFPDGVKVPGGNLELDPVSAAFSIATSIRWLDFNDALSTPQGGHPSDNLGGILAVADYVSRSNRAKGRPTLVMRDVLTALIKAYEVQGVLSLENHFVRVGLDYTVLAKVATTAVLVHMLGGSRDMIINAISNAWADGAALAIYRQGDNTGPRASWAGGDAASRSVQLAFMALKGDMGYPSVLTAETHGFQDAVLKGLPLKVPRPYGTHVIEHLLAFKLVPAGMQAQTLGECAVRLHPAVKDRLDDIESILIRSHDRMIRVLDKKGTLTNPADRGHCAQYVVAVLLIHGKIGSLDFDDKFASDPRIDRLREKMTVVEEPAFTRDFNDPAKRSNRQSIDIGFKDRSRLPTVEVEYPLGYPPLTDEVFACVEQKFSGHLAHNIPPERRDAILELFRSQARLEETPVDAFIDLLAK